MQRRDFLRGLAAGAAAFASGRALGAEAPKRPNILFIMSDDHASHAMSCYGSRINKTPNLDRIATEGMRLDNCFCTNSICTPSRATILTGKYSHKNGCRGFNRFDGSQQTFPKLLQKAGYHTGMIGKWHLGSDPTGFDYWNILPGQGKYHDPDMIEMGRKHKRTGYVTDILTDEALKFLRARPKDKPFCLLYHHKAPHDTWEYDQKHAGLYADRDVPEPDNLFDDYAHRGQAIKRVTQKIGMRHTAYPRESAGLEGKAKKKKQYQVYIKKYLRCVASVDDNVKRVLDYLDAEGLADDTIVMYTSDQGFYLGDHGMYDKRFMYEESLRMPFIVRYPRAIKPGTRSDAIVLNIDFAELLLDYAGVKPPPDMQGRSFRGVLEGKTPRDWRRVMYYRYWLHLPHFRVAAHFGVRTKTHKLIYYYGLPLGTPGARNTPTPPEWELFDLVKDPREMHNVFDDPAYADVVRQLAGELKRLRKQYDDEADGIDIDQALKARYDPAKEPDFDRRPPRRGDGQTNPQPGAKPTVTNTAFGHKLETFGPAFSSSVRQLPKAYTRKVTLRLKLRSVAAGGQPRNGFVVFGGGTGAAQLMRCGLYIGAGTLAVEKHTDGDQEGATRRADLPKDKVFDVQVTADLVGRKVTMTVDGGPPLSTTLAAGITQVTHVGYCCWSRTATEFSEMDVQGQ